MFVGGLLVEGERERDRRPAVRTDSARSRVLGLGEVGEDVCDRDDRVGEMLRLLELDAPAGRGVCDLEAFLGLLLAD